MTAPLIRLHDIEAFERWTPFARPFRFGAVTVEGAWQAFVRLGVEVEGGARATGASAELMPPKWFDKRAERSAAATVADLRASLAHAVSTGSEPRPPDTAFGLHAAHHGAQGAWAHASDITALSAGFGVALIDKAILDGLAKALGASFVEMLNGNAVGLDTRLTPDLDQAAIHRMLAGLKPHPSIAIRHTIGLNDEIDGEGGLAAELDASDLRFFKIKLSGDPAADHLRLSAIAGLIDRRGIDYQVTVDANEQYAPADLLALFALIEADPKLGRFIGRLLLVEQPFDRRITFDSPLDPRLAARTVIIDEADDAYDAFPRALALGYRGVSAKSCKGLYKALLNAARVAVANAQADAAGAPFVLSAEDLTCQPGLAVQQDTALVAALGLGHVERNGHHYVDGFGQAPASEAEAFLAAHPDLYTRDQGRIRLAAARGRLATSSLFGPGFASGAMPDWASLSPLANSTEGLPS
ncbi:enolase [Phreatobacter stygius]|uniref:Enolase n=1 Tax=Phreatobacter stygius TaxID=1940610 RepID=A0A4D7AWA7_9HYPH|nr:enolase [Phreatobacter stygius]QCI63158.1 enolase [Phreatobacter stygius]